jgi:hypothetical protein
MEDKDRSCMFKLTALRCYNLSYVRVYTILSIASDSRNSFFCIKEGRHFVFKIYHWGVMYVCYGYRLCQFFFYILIGFGTVLMVWYILFIHLIYESYLPGFIILETVKNFGVTMEFYLLSIFFP